MNRRIRNRTYGGVKGRQGDLPPILIDKKILTIRRAKRIVGQK